MGRIDEIEKRLTELELLITAHRANLVREEWIGNEIMLKEVADAINDIAACLPTKHRIKEEIAQYLVSINNDAAQAHGVDSEPYHSLMGAEIAKLKSRAQRGTLITTIEGELDSAKADKRINLTLE